MAGYGRAPNVSQYIANLNTLPSGPDSQQDIANLDDDLAYFTNAELFDFDLNNGNVAAKPARGRSLGGANVDFSAAAGFDPFFDGDAIDLNTNFASTENFDPQLFQSPQSATFAAASPQQQAQGREQQSLEQDDGALAASNQVAGSKRSHSVSSPASVEDAARMAAEEDKRRRNTAASARFRVKKKQREAALEKTAKEMTDRVDELQKRVSELEMENKWLRGLVVEKGVAVKQEDDEQADEAAAAANVERIPGKQAKKGVGTKAE